MPSPAINGVLVGQKLGKYELLALIAVGGTAEIYLARISGASGFEKYLVVKCLLDHLADDQEFVRMFLDEARVSAQLDHSNIVQTLELGEHKGRYFLVMEYLAGMSVAQMARKTQERGIHGGLIDPNIVFGMAAQTCGGLHYAHAKMMHGKSLNLVHRDISPQNLVVSFEGILKIVDFGIAKSDMREVQTRTGTIKGKFAYMSPEQCLAKHVDHRTDIFALGTLCHELLTGRRLFKRQTTYDTYQAIVNGGVPTPSSLNPKLDAEVDKVVMKALSYEPEGRYDNAQAFGEALLELLHHRGGSGGPGEISRFFEDYFNEDIEAHANQMRELVTGHRAAVAEGTWDSEVSEGEGPELAPEPPRKPASAPPAALAKPALAMPLIKPPRPNPSNPLSTGAPLAAPRAKLGAIPTILPKAPDADVDAQDDDEGPTRIEFNPADKIAAYHDDDNSDLDRDWMAPTKLSDAADVDGMQQESLGAGPIDVGDISAEESGNLPAVPSAAPPQRSEGGNRNFATPPETIEISQVNGKYEPSSKGPPGPSPQAKSPQAQEPSQPVHARGPMQPNMTIQGQQAAFQPPGNASTEHHATQNAPTPEVRQPIAPLARPQIQNNPYAHTGSYGAAPQMLPNLPSGQPQAVAPRQSKESPPLWMHLAIFAAFAGLGLGVAAFFKMLL